MLSYTINVWPNIVFLPVGNLHRSCQLIKFPERSDNIISKIFESFFNDSLTKQLDITGLFSDLQYGFRTFLSTADTLTVLSESIYNSLDAGGETRAIALDISKAFNRVWHAGLLHKQKAYGVVGPVVGLWCSG